MMIDFHRRYEVYMSTAPISVPEYYQLPFRFLHDTHSTLIENSYLRLPREARIGLVDRLFERGSMLDGRTAYQGLRDVLSGLEQELKRIVSKRSRFYWIHLYRRLSPHLAESLGDNTGPMTLAWVRLIAEQAIFKFGLAEISAELQLSNSISSKKILGGYFLKAVNRAFGEGSDAANLYINSLSRSQQWVITEFRPSDLAKVYQIEGLAYEYWYVTAKMRAAGKDIPIKVTADGQLKEQWSMQDEVLIDSFDRRLGANSMGFTSNVGTFSRSSLPELGESLIFVGLNAYQYPLPAMGDDSLTDFATGESLVPNFLPNHLNIAQYYQAHRYLEPAFKKLHGFGLREFCFTAYLMSELLVSASVDSDREINMHNVQRIFQRGYVFYGHSISTLRGDILKRAEAMRASTVFGGCQLETEIDAILHYLTLNAENVGQVGLWSGGRRFAIIPFGHYAFYDIASWPFILRNLFFGLRKYDPKNQKGSEFEGEFAETAKSEGLKVVLQSREITIGGHDREVDVAIRASNVLFVCECRAFERPLDFSIGNPKTIQARCDDLQKKVEQALSLADLLRRHPKGAEYDVSWATEVIPVVISPYVEWVWSLDDSLWISKSPMMPRILSPGEAIEMMTRRCQAE